MKQFFGVRSKNWFSRPNTAFRSFHDQKKIPTLVNNKIKAKTGYVQLIMNNGENKGDVKFEEAMRIAKEMKLDLLQVSIRKEDNGDLAGVPICRLLDYRKVQEEENNTKKKKLDLKKYYKNKKEVQFSSNLAINDLKRKIDQVNRFLSEGKMVKLRIKVKFAKIAPEERRVRAEKVLKEVLHFMEEAGVGDEERSLRSTSASEVTLEYHRKRQPKEN